MLERFWLVGRSRGSYRILTGRTGRCQGREGIAGLNLVIAHLSVSAQDGHTATHAACKMCKWSGPLTGYHHAGCFVQTRASRIPIPKCCHHVCQEQSVHISVYSHAFAASLCCQGLSCFTCNILILFSPSAKPRRATPSQLCVHASNVLS